MNTGLIIGIISLALVSIYIVAVVVVVIRMNTKTTPTTTSASGPTSGPDVGRGGPRGGPTPTPTPSKNKGDTLLVEQFLPVGDYLQNGNYTATLGGQNGRLVLSNGSTVRGSEYNASVMGVNLVVQSDGNLAILDKGGNPCWAALTLATNSPSMILPNDTTTRLFLQPDGNLALYNSRNLMVWLNSNTPSGTNTLRAGQFLLAGDYLKSGLSSVRLEGQYNRITVWAGKFIGSGIDWNPTAVGFKLLMQPDGNLVILDKDGKVCWSAINYSPNKPAQINPNDTTTRAFLRSDGNIILYNSRDAVTWTAF